jgi:hypothetical protein
MHKYKDKQADKSKADKEVDVSKDNQSKDKEVQGPAIEN